jgi:tripeptide aminopeptidase
MAVYINSQRLAQSFMELVRIDSISRQERMVGSVLIDRLKALGAQVMVDQAGQQVGGDMGNIIAWVDGKSPAEPLLLSAHMDTVEPGRGILPRMDNGVIHSSGETILGADDKSAIAVILEVLTCLQEQKISHGPLEVVFTICEEIGLLGARYLDYSRLRARSGYVLDTSNHKAMVTRAPGANQLKFSMYGKAAHAGGAPERGINAVWLAAQAIAALQIGRIDHETTCNIGIIQGGLATNIVPALVVAQGEVRSHDSDKLERVTQTMVAAFEKVVADYQGPHHHQAPRVQCAVHREFDRMAVAEDHPTVKLAQQAASGLDMPMALVSSGGGSDANVFAQHGMTTPVLGTGMKDVHTVEESIALADMAQSAQLLLDILRQHGSLAA